MITITKQNIRNMTSREAIELLVDETMSHIRGIGCGLDEHIPESDRAKKLATAIVKMYKRVYGSDFINGMFSIYIEGQPI